MDRKTHWDNIYRAKGPFNVSWYTPHLDTSLTLIEHTGGGLDAAIIDIGGGASTLVDDLLNRQYSRVTVLDISQTALDQSQQRLGGQAHLVKWIQGDILSTSPCPPTYDVWHDRAVFHFLTDPLERQQYLDTLRR